MGLDQWAFKMTEQVEADVDFDHNGAEEMFYWRKHPDLHGWMERLYREKGGANESFNCVAVKLTLDDIDRLEADVESKALPHTEGFFFGHSEDEDRDRDREFVRLAREALVAGHTVLYTSWW